MFRIGNVTLATNLLLAPMARYADLAFRLIVRPLGGVGLACTDLVHPRGVLRQGRKTLELLATEPGDQPLCVQLYGREPNEMAAAAQWCCANGAAVIDINMGCPVDKVCRRGGGAALLRDPAAAVRVAERVVRAVDAPVTAKLRLGWDGDNQVAPALARALEDVGVAAVAVHGRTAAQGYGGEVCLDGIARVVKAVCAMPVIGNGDVRAPADAQRMSERTGCAAIMIGRAALRDPWIFRHTDAWLTTGHVPPPPTVADRVALMHRHFGHLVRLRGERVAALKFRQRVSWYAAAIGVPPSFLAAMRALTTVAQYRQIAQTHWPDVACDLDATTPVDRGASAPADGARTADALTAAAGRPDGRANLLSPSRSHTATSAP